MSLIKPYTICQASVSDFEIIKKFIKQFDLDNRDLQQQQFLVAKDEQNKLIGFGRIRKHKGCDEFCSLGVIEEFRNSGVAKELVEARIRIATQPIYLVCIIPNYFEKLGFKIVQNFPIEIVDKLNYCKGELIVPEEYVVMNYSKSI